MKLLRVLLCCAVAAALPAQAQKVCSKADATAAEKAIDRVVTWPSLQRAYQDYGHCNTDQVNDLFTDAVLRLMVEWKNVDAISAAVEKDPAYKKWIHARLQSPAAKDDLQDVYSRAKASCPRGQDAFCAELADVAKPGAGGKSAGSTSSGGLQFETLTPIQTQVPTEKKK